MNRNFFKLLFLLVATLTFNAALAENTASVSASKIVEEKTELSIHELRQYEVLFVPGFLYDPLKTPSRNAVLRKLRLGEYFDELRQWLQAHDVDESIAEIDSEDSITDNAHDLAAYLKFSDKPVILVSHSKGGLEGLELLLLYPELRKRVAGWIALQAPFYGSEVADTAYSVRPVRALSKKLIEDYWGGSLRALIDLRTETRQQYMNLHLSEILQITREVPILVMGSSYYLGGGLQSREGVRKMPGTLGLPALLPLTVPLAFGAGANDGLVGLQSARLPGARFVEYAQIDHADPVMPFPGRRFDRLGLFKSLMTETLAMIKESGQSENP